MKPGTIEQLIEKFYAGETSPAEEEQLKAYLLGDNIPEHFHTLKAQFGLMDAMSREQLPADFDDLLMNKLQKESGKKVNHTFTWWMSGVAATILILIAFWFGTDLLQPKEVYGTINDPGLAFVETKKVLDDVSKKLNKGLTPAKTTVDKVESGVQKAGELKEINKALEKAKKIDKMENASDLLKSLNKVYIRIGNS